MADLNSSLPVTDTADGTAGASVPAVVQLVGGKDGSSNLQPIKVSTAGVVSVDGSAVTQPISAASLPLPTGASTSALQTTGNASLSSIDTKTPALGQALAAASTPVVLTAAQLTTLTPLSTVVVTQSTSPWVVSGTVAATQSGTWNITNISGTVSLPTGAATSANQTSEISLLTSIDTGVPAALGQTTMSASMPVVIASNQSAIPTTSKNAMTPSSPANVSVGITSASAVAANASRKGLVLTNVSINRISFGLGVAAVLNSGITLYPGGVWVMDEYTYNTGAINAIASLASSGLAVQEFT